MSKWSTMARLSRPVTTMIWSMPAATASSTPYWMMGLSTTMSISFGCALVAGRKRVPSPAAGSTALRTLLRLLVGQSGCAAWGVAEGVLVMVSVFHTLQGDEYHSSMWLDAVNRIAQ